MGKIMTALFGSLFNFLAKYFSVQMAFNLASMTIMIALVVSLVASFRSCAQGVCSLAITNAATEFPSFAMGLGIAFNTTTYTAASCYMAVWSACQLYNFKKKMLGVLENGK